MKLEKSELAPSQPLVRPGIVTATSVAPAILALRELLEACRSEFDVSLTRNAASNVRLFDSAARDGAKPGSDIDILTNMGPAYANLLMRPVS